ncbi:hypothetical protein BH24ACT7_BH24ACT7_00530 [soil metagenome]
MEASGRATAATDTGLIGHRACGDGSRADHGAALGYQSPAR